MRSARMTIWVMLVVCMVSSQATALIEWNDGNTYNVDWQIPEGVRVDYEAPGMETTVNLLNGGQINGNLRAYEDSHINVSGGSVGNIMWAYGNSQIDFSAGSVSQELNAYGNSHIVFSDGWIGKDLNANDNSHIEMSGGVANVGIDARDSGQVHLYGGAVSQYLQARDSGQIFFSGGSVAGDLVADVFGVLTIYGSDFAVDSQPFGYGELTSILGGDSWDESTRHLSGTLANGDQLDNNFYIGHDASIILVPEPSTLLLLGLGGIFLRKRQCNNRD